MERGRELPAGSVELLMREAEGTISGEEFVNWAVRALVEGFDSPALRRLAGLDGSSCFEAKPFFDRAAVELGLRLPVTTEAVRRAYLDILAREVLNGIRRPADALQVIHREVIEPLSHPEDLMSWCYLWEGLEPGGKFVSLSDSERDEATFDLARRTLGKDSAA